MKQRKEYFIPDRELEPKRMSAYCHLMDYQRSEDVWHKHAFDELVIVRSGEGRHVTEHGSYPITRGDTFLIPRGQFHAYEKMKHLKIANLLFLRSALKEKCGDLAESPGYHVFFENSTRFKEEFRFNNSQPLSPENLQECEQIFSRMQMEQNPPFSPGHRLMNELLFLNLCVIICRSFSDYGQKHSPEISKLGSLFLFMEKHHAEPLRLHELARRAGRSIPSLTLLFRNATDTSPIEYLNRIRLEIAARDLRETDSPISAIAFAHGFSDSNYFSARFTRLFGQSPRNYRKRFR